MTRRGTVVAFVALIALWVGCAISVQEQFFADGAHYFLKLLEERWFIYAEDFPRHHAHYLTQGPVVALMAMGVNDFDLLCGAFGIGMFLPPLLGLGASLYALRDLDVRWMIFPVLAVFAVSANESFVTSSESYVTAALFWPLLLLLVFRTRYGAIDSVVLLVTGLLFIRTYESVAVYGAMLCCVLLLQARKHWRGSSALTHFSWGALLVILLAGMAIATHSTLYPRAAANRSDFIASFAKIGQHWPFLVSLGFVVAVLGFAAFDAHGESTLPWRATLVVLAPAAAFVALTPAILPEAMRPGMHYASRSAIVLTPPVLGLALVLLARRGGIGDVSWRRMWQLVALLAVGQVTWQVLAASQWAGFRKVFREQLATHRGVVAYETTPLGRDGVGIQLMLDLTWRWTQPTLSVLWADKHVVSSIVLNNAITERGHWQPFDPTVPAQLPKLSRYGFTFEPYLGALPGAPSPEAAARPAQ
jgi:hypothetical protein